MSAAGRSVFVFGIYLLILGIGIVVAPSWLLGIVGLPGTTEVWIRVVGVLALVLGFYYLQAGRKSLNEYCLWSIMARAGAFLFFLAFVLLGFAQPVFILFGVLDLAGAVWTFVALQTGV